MTDLLRIYFVRALLMVCIGAISGIAWYWLCGNSWPILPFLAAVFGGVGLVLPKVFTAFRRKVAAGARWLGYLNGFLVFFIMYIAMILPVGLIVRFMSGLYSKENTSDSYYLEPENRMIKNMDRMF